MNAPLRSLIAAMLVAGTHAAPLALNHGHHHHVRDVVTHTVVVEVTAGAVNTANFVENANVEAETAAAAATTISTSTTAAEQTTPVEETTTSATVAAVATSEAAQDKSVSTSDSSSSDSGSFTDGTIACSDFPSAYGAVAVDWVGFGGWASVMAMDGSTADSCQDGFYCSYACAAGESKTQWPSTQPSDGKSVGGLLCKGGYLYRSNTDSDSLCESGVGSASAKSELSDDVALCRTDYPGSENMVIPTLLEAGSTASLSVVDEDTYFTWEGLKTSTQYYVNNAGVSIEDGCIWGSSGSGVGNWAPLVVGAGYTNGLSYISLIPNPNNSAAANFNVKIVATEGSSINGDCYYENGSFSSSDGCTVTVVSGSAELVFY